MKNIKINNINKLIVATLNVNSISNKFEQLKTFIIGNIDILILVETKLDDTFPTSQFLIEGYLKPYRLDRNRNGGGILLYVREDIPSKELSKYKFPTDIEGICIEINLRKCKWFLFGTYHPPSQKDQYYFDHVGKALDVYSEFYDKMLLAGDFNAEEGESCFDSFLFEYNLKNLVKEKTCYKNPENPSCIDLFLTSNARSFQKTTTVSTGLSDFHKMIVTVLKTNFTKQKPKEIIYRSYKNFEKTAFRADLKSKIEEIENRNYVNFENVFIQTLENHAALKKKIVRANHAPYMTKTLRKAIMRRSALENTFYKNNTIENNITL